MRPRSRWNGELKEEFEPWDTLLTSLNGCRSEEIKTAIGNRLSANRAIVDERKRS